MEQDSQINIRVNQKSINRWKRLAQNADTSLSEVVRLQLDKWAAKEAKRVKK